MRPLTRDARLSALHRGGFGPRGRASVSLGARRPTTAGICLRVRAASSSLAGDFPGLPGRAVTSRPPQDATPRSACYRPNGLEWLCFLYDREGGPHRRLHLRSDCPFGDARMISPRAAMSQSLSGASLAMTMRYVIRNGKRIQVETVETSDGSPCAAVEVLPTLRSRFQLR